MKHQLFISFFFVLFGQISGKLDPLSLLQDSSRRGVHPPIEETFGHSLTLTSVNHLSRFPVKHVGKLTSFESKQIHPALINDQHALYSPLQHRTLNNQHRNVTRAFFTAVVKSKPSVRPTPRPSSKPTPSPTFSPNIFPTFAPNSQLIQAGITYHGGSVMTGTIPVYIIWYGDWSGSLGLGSSPQSKAILEYFMTYIGGSPWMNIQTTYTGPGMSRISNKVAYAGSVSQAASTKTLSNTASKVSIVTSVLNAGSLPVDPNALYVILPSQDIRDLEGSCSSYCGYHSYFPYSSSSVSSSQLKFIFVTNPDSPTCSNQGCYYFSANTANNIAAADGMVSVLAHEITEAITDPDVSSGWYDSAGNENADKCAWTYGTLFSGNNGYLNSNMVLGTKSFLVQRNWVNEGVGYCGMSYGVATTAQAKESVSGQISTSSFSFNSFPPTPSPTGTSPIPTSSPSFSPNNYPTYSPNFQLVQAGISYHSGPILTGNVPVYLIWYGDWSGTNTASSPASQQIILDFVNNLGGSSWLNIQTTYSGPSSSRVSNQLYLAGTTSISASYLSLNDTLKSDLIQYVLSNGVFPADSNSLYFILPSQEITDPDGSCTSFCGWHTYSMYQASVNSQIPIYWGFITHPDSPTCSNQGCYYYNANTANGIAAADGMVSVLAHEITEAATDPDVSSGWYDSLGYENADKCAWTYGNLIGGYNGYYNSNMVLGSRTYLIQRNWVNSGSGYCSVSYGLSSPPTTRPTTRSTLKPSPKPSVKPPFNPTSKPTRIPTSQPVFNPTPEPTQPIGANPTVSPTSKPSVPPTSKPTFSAPTTKPTTKPTSLLTSKPTALPTSKPTSKPNTLPTSKPTSKPNTLPTSKPTFKPSVKPTYKPTSLPSNKPAVIRPTTKPTVAPS